MQCKKHQAATKKLELYQVPDILVICIKRFGSSRRLSDKLDQMVSFPMEGLDLSDRIDERKIAKSLALNEEEAAEFGFQNGDEPVIYDLCTYCKSLHVFSLTRRCRGQPLWRSWRGTLHCLLPQQGRRSMVQLRRLTCFESRPSLGPSESLHKPVMRY